jgi:hypothetical protein
MIISMAGFCIRGVDTSDSILVYLVICINIVTCISD